MRLGKFITFEGGEGSGKSTQSKLLCEWLENNDIQTCWTREPGGTPAAEILREVILSGAASPFGAEFEVLMFYAARMDHVNQLIIPKLNKRDWVICDRFYDSTTAYQTASGGASKAFIDSVHNICLQGFKPDLTFIFDIDPEIARDRVLSRAALRGETVLDRFESEGMDFHKTVREQFQQIGLENADRCHIIDAEQPIELMQQQVQEIVKTTFLTYEISGLNA